MGFWSNYIFLGKTGKSRVYLPYMWTLFLLKKVLNHPTPDIQPSFLFLGPDVLLPWLTGCPARWGVRQSITSQPDRLARGTAGLKNLDLNPG